MKIIDRNKDYYDYLSGIYGIDELVVFDRRENFVLQSDTSDFPYKDWEFIFFDKRIDEDNPRKKNRNYWFKNGKFHRKDNLAGEFYFFVLEAGLTRFYFSVERFLDEKGNVQIERKLILTNQIIRKSDEFPLILYVCEKPYYYQIDEIKPEDFKIRFNKKIVNPILKDNFISKQILPETVWKEIYNYLATKSPEITDNRNDIERLESKGFDKKSSFRHPLK